ncbi:hypothetical protein CJ030_MR2G006058 [Morella rubra]|uniref:Uncharacterized protein n=1 Tax=Morella rubra TaxID=262757 RepID=A0A6A1WFI3_9ROSI|nr:hypothetical protein CJ030_MR2G006058 [Morella rubra]
MVEKELQVGHGSLRKKYHQGRGIDRATSLSGHYGSGAKGEYPDESEADAYVYMDLHTRLTTLENNFGLTERGLSKEVIAMRMELTSVIEYMSQLYQSLSTLRYSSGRSSNEWIL